MDQASLQRYAQLKARSAPQGGGDNWFVRNVLPDPAPKYNPKQSQRDPSYQSYVDEKAKSYGSTSGYRDTAIGSATFGFSDKIASAGAALIESLPALINDDDFDETYKREYASNLDAQRIAQGDYAAESPKSAIAAGIGGALVGGGALMKVGGSAIRGAGALSGSQAGMRLAEGLTRASPGFFGNLGQQAALGAGMGGLYAAGYDQDITQGAAFGAGAGVLGSLAISGAGKALRTAPALTTAAGVAAATGAAGLDPETRGALAVGAGVLASRSGRRIAGTALERILRGGTRRVAAKAPKMQADETDLAAGAKTEAASEISEASIRSGRQALRRAGIAAGGRTAARDITSAMRNQGMKPSGAMSILSNVGGAKRALATLGDLWDSWKSMRARLGQYEDDIAQMTRQGAQADERLAVKGAALKSANAELAAMREERALLARSMNEARQAIGVYQDALKAAARSINEQRLAADNASDAARLQRQFAQSSREDMEALERVRSMMGGAEIPKGQKPPLSEAEFAAGTRQIQEMSQRMSQIEQGLEATANMRGVRDMARANADLETQYPGAMARSGSRLAAYENQGSLGRLFDRRTNMRELEPAVREGQIPKILAERAPRIQQFKQQAEQLLSQIDETQPGMRNLADRARSIIANADELQGRQYQGATRTTPGQAAKLQADETADAGLRPNAANAGRIEGLQAEVRKTLDSLGLEDIDVEVVTDQAMMAITGGQAARGVMQGTKLLLNIDRVAADTVTHEVVHGLREMGLIRPQEWGSLVGAAKRVLGKEKPVGDGSGSRLDEIKSMPAYRDLDEAAMDEEIVAQYVGPRLAKAVESGKTPTATTGASGLVRRLIDVGRGLREAITKAEIDPDEIINRMASGTVGARGRNIFEPGVFDRMNRRFASFAAYASPKTAQERARAEAAQEFGVRLTKGQQTGNVGQLQREDAYAAGAYGTSAQDVMERAYSQQRVQVDAAIEDVSGRLGLGAPTTNPLDAMVEVSEGIARREASRRGWGGNKYRRLEEAGEKVTFTDPASLVSTLRKALDENFLLPESRAARMVDRIEKAVSDNGDRFSFKEFREIRSKLLAAKRNTAPGSTESYEMSTVTRALDDWFDDAIEKGGLSAGTDKELDKAIRGLRDANKYWRKYKEAFAVDKAGTSTDKRAQRIIQMMADREIGPNELVRDILGLNQVGGSELSTRLLSKLERILNYRAQEVKGQHFTPDYLERIGYKTLDSTVSSSAPKYPSPEWQAVRGAAFRVLTEAPPGKAEFGYRKMAQRIDTFLNGSGKGAAGILFEPEERALLKRFAETMRALDRQQGRGNPSGSGYTMYRLAWDLGQRIFGASIGYSLGERFGGPGGGMAGAMMGAAGGAPLGRMINQMRGAAGARAAMRGAAMPQTVAQEGFNIWARAKGALAGAGIGSRELSRPPAR